MGLEGYQQCVLMILFLSIQGAMHGEIMECGIGENQFIAEAMVECYHSKELKKFPLENKGCMLLNCDPSHKIVWKMLDETLGKMEVQLHDMQDACDFDYYDIDLEVYDAPGPLNESHNCFAGSILWKTHSKRTIKHEECSACLENSQICLQTDCMSPVKPCFVGLVKDYSTSEKYTLIFKYMYPSLYRLKLTPRFSDGSTRQSELSRHFKVDEFMSKYVKKRLVDLSVNISLQYRDSARQLDVGIPLLVDIPPEIVGFEVKYSADLISLYEITKFGIGNETKMICSLGKRLSKPVCKATSGLIECTFFNMTAGDYKIVVQFTDDRCAMSTIWTDSISDTMQDPCRWDVKREYSGHPAPKKTFIDSSYSGVLYSTIALSVLIIVVLVAFFLRRRRSSRQRLFDHGESNDSPRATLYNFNGQSSSNRFNFGQLLTLSDKPRPEVLLIYTRESPAFMELVSRLRRILDKICKCQVYDYFDPDLWNEISQDPEGWIRTLIDVRQTKVIIIASEVGAIRQQSLMYEYPELSYKSPHPFDHLFLYALKLLRDGMNEDSYKNHFVVMFDGFTDSKYILEYFNPYTRFVLPKHLGKLFEHLHDSDNTVHFDTSSRLEERYEVRQLRLQLEHLINLKLLMQGEVRKKKLSDW